LPAVASGQVFSTGFEDYDGSPEGTPLTYGFGGGGQHGWYNPVDGSVDFDVYTYAGNALGFPANPTGEDQFVGAVGPGGVYGRAQRDHPFGEYTYTIGYDICAGFFGDLPAANNLGSFSLQVSSTDRHFIALNVWDDVNTATNWSAYYMVADEAGTFDAQPGRLAGPEWAGLVLNHWYRQSITFDLLSNQILLVTMKDLHTGDEGSFAPPDWYLSGGAGGGGRPLPTAFRFFAGGGNPGNGLGFDNLEVIPEPGLVAFAALGVLGAFGLRRKK
jgi:hypothetical protein